MKDVDNKNQIPLTVVVPESILSNTAALLEKNHLNTSKKILTKFLLDKNHLITFKKI